MRLPDSHFDPEEIVTLYGHGRMTLRTAVERVLAKDLWGLDSTVFRQGKPSILGGVGVEKLAAGQGVTRQVVLSRSCNISMWVICCRMWLRRSRLRATLLEIGAIPRSL